MTNIDKLFFAVMASCASVMVVTILLMVLDCFLIEQMSPKWVALPFAAGAFTATRVWVNAERIERWFDA